MAAVTSDGEGNLENWRRIAEDRLQKLNDLQNEYSEFQMTSRDFEAELERELDAKDRALKDANVNHSRIVEERDNLRNRVVTLQSELARLETEADQLRTSELNYRDIVRQLEQKNDDLERSLRVTASSLEDLEQRFSQALEEKALLSSELSEKEALQVAVQRLKDEVRDLRQELSVRVNDQLPQVQSNPQRRRNTDAAPQSPTILNGNGLTFPSTSAPERAPSISEPPLPSPTTQQPPAAVQPRRSIGVSTRQAALDCVQQLINCVTMMETKVDQLKRRMDREPLNGNIPGNSMATSTGTPSKTTPTPILSTTAVNGRAMTGENNNTNAVTGRHAVVQQVPVQSVTPRRF